MKAAEKKKVNKAVGVVVEPTYFNEILRDYEALGLHETNFAQTAFELYRGYLEALENMPQRLLWGGMAFKVTEWPRSELTLTVYTLSRERDWLAL